MKTNNPYKSGLEFEKFVEQIYRNNGCRSIRHNVYYPLQAKNEQLRHFQIDLTYVPALGFRRRFVECKFTSADVYSDFKEVAYFASKLRLLGISPKRGDFVCNRPFPPDIVLLADSFGLKLIDRDELVGLWKRGRLLGFIPQIKASGFSLEKLLACLPDQLSMG
ncbi:MAG: restriction endonuclease [Candidatus Woesearchaeota archaeon]